MKELLKAAELPKMHRKPARCHIHLGLIAIDRFQPKQ